MDSVAAITRKIANSDFPSEVKKALVIIFNAELAESTSKGVAKSIYQRELQQILDANNDSIEGDGQK